MHLVYALLFFIVKVIFEVNCTVPVNATVATVLDNGTLPVIDVPEEVTVPEQTYSEAEKEIVNFMNSLFRQLLPKIVGGSGSSVLSPICTSGMMKVISNTRRLKGWTFKMLDSMGKTAPGILKGTSYTLGNYDECLDLSITSKGQETTNNTQELFRGKYCRIRIQFRQVVIDAATKYHKGSINETSLGKLKEIIQNFPYIPAELQYMNHFIGLCFPSICTDADISELAKLIPFPGTASLDRCEVRIETEVDSYQIIITSILLFLFILVTLSTFVDWLLHTRSNSNSASAHDKKCLTFSMTFSICNNTRQLMKNIIEDVDGLLSGKNVRGIVVASVAWIIVGHTYVSPFEAFYLQASNLEKFNNYWNEEYFSIIQSYPLAIDGLFVCYGFVITYSIWHETTKSQNISVNIFGLLIKYYTRYCIPLIFCLGLIILLPLFGSGPFWADMTDSLDQCKESFWSYIGMYANFLDLKDQCLPHLWFVPCLAQLTIFGILLSWILSKNIKFGVFIILLLCVASNTVVGVITYTNEFPLSYMPYFSKQASSLFWQINLSLPLSHFGPFAVGMLTGILISRRENHTIGMCKGGLGWIACLSLLYGIFSVPFVFRDGSLGPYWSSVYASLHRTAFGICVSWVMIAGCLDVGGSTNAILSWRIFDPLYKLSYYAYLFHPIIIAFVVGISRTHSLYSHLELVMKITFYIAASYTMAYIFFMLLEMPLRSLRLALCPAKRQELNVTPMNNFKIPTVNVISKNSIEGNCKLWAITETFNGELK